MAFYNDRCECDRRQRIRANIGFAPECIGIQYINDYGPNRSEGMGTDWGRRNGWISGRRLLKQGAKRRCVRKPKKRRRARRVLGLAACYYYALGDGETSVFTMKQALPGYPNKLPHPARISLANIFVDGILQPPDVCRLEPGGIRFLSLPPPMENAVIVAQFLAISRRKRKPRLG